MSRYTLKSSTVFVSVGEKTRVFRSVEEVPPELKLHFERSKGRLRPRTLLIADAAGREEIVRALQGLPSSLKPRWNAESLKPAHPSLTAGILTPAPVKPGTSWTRSQIFGEVALATLIGAAITLAFWFS
jgi:hypothetical protein